MVKKRFSSVREMVSGLSNDKDFVQKFTESSESRNVTRKIVALRCLKGLTQKEIAKRTGSTQSRISKLENGTDQDLRLGDLAKYIEALGLHSRILVSDGKMTLADQVKFHSLGIRDCLAELADLVGNDNKMASGLAGLMGTTIFNVLDMAQEIAKKLPTKPETEEPSIQIDLQELEIMETKNTGDHTIESTSPDDTATKLPQEEKSLP